MRAWVRHASHGFPMAGMPESDLAERSTVILGFRFFALAAVVGTASLLPADRVSLPLVVIGVLLASGTAALQHFARTRLSHEAAKWFIWPQVGVWTLLIHATGGPGSPLALGYLFELPLSGALLGRRGVVIVGLASIAFYLSYAVSLGSFEARVAAILLAMIVLCATITWWVVGILERQRSRIERSRAWLADRADTLAAELRNLGESLLAGLVSIDDRGRIASLNP
jgi:hypothetical protein